MAVSAYVLINTQTHETKNALETLRTLPNVISAKAVTGPYDIIAAVQADDVSALGEIVTEVVHGTRGIKETLTCIVFENL